MNNVINTLTIRISYNNFTYYFKTKSNAISLNNFNPPLGLKRKIIDGYVDLEKASENQKNLNQI